MFKLTSLVMVVVLAGCTQAQRFALSKNAELDECAMKRMSESKINGQQGYLQAQYECHSIVNIRKFHELNLVRQPEYLDKAVKDPIEKNPGCWEFVKGLYIDEHYPEDQLVRRSVGWGVMPSVAQKEIEDRNDRLRVLPDKIAEISDEKLIEIYELMAVKTTIGKKTTCNLTRYHELESGIGGEIKRRKG